VKRGGEAAGLTRAGAREVWRCSDLAALGLRLCLGGCVSGCVSAGCVSLTAWGAGERFRSLSFAGWECAASSVHVLDVFAFFFC
jgi:hypothetical protein